MLLCRIFSIDNLVMCGRFAIRRDKKTLLQQLGAGGIKDADNFACGEVFPSQEVLIKGADVWQVARWGLSVSWQKNLLINARAESVAEKKTFRQAFHYHRCLVPADGYYEWKNHQRHFIHYANNQVFQMAGLYFTVADTPAVVIITTIPNDVAAQAHHRMPVIIDESHQQTWLSSNNSEELNFLMQPVAAEGMLVESVDKSVLDL